MAVRREPAVLALNDDDTFVGPMRRAAAAAAAPLFMREWALMDATWEPHDWSDF